MSRMREQFLDDGDDKSNPLHLPAEPAFSFAYGMVSKLDALDKDEPLVEPKDYKRCAVSEMRTLVAPSGAYICPYFRGCSDKKIGDANTQSFAEIWEGQRRAEVSAATDPSRDCRFHCIRHQSNLLMEEMLAGGEVDRVEAVGIPVLSLTDDIANARLRFADGCVANLTASRVSAERLRKIRLFQSDAYISIDFGESKIAVVRREGAPGAQEPPKIHAEQIADEPQREVPQRGSERAGLTWRP